jgi:hypothetical protein
MSMSGPPACAAGFTLRTNPEYNRQQTGSPNAYAIITRSTRLQRNLDIRLLVNTFNDRLQWANGASESHWLDLLDSRMRQRTLPLTGSRGGRTETKDRELDIVRRIAHLPPQERLDIWQKETGKSQAQ